MSYFTPHDDTIIPDSAGIICLKDTLSMEYVDGECSTVAHMDYTLGRIGEWVY